MVQWIIGVLVGILLACSAWLDVRTKQVSVLLLAFFALAGLGVYILFRPFHVCSLAGGVGIGLVMMLASKVTDGGIGMGDGGLLCVTGLYLGFYKNIAMLFAALALAAFGSAFLIMIRKAGRKTEMPFVPFLAAAYVGMVLI